MYSNEYRSNISRPKKLPPTPVSTDERARMEKFCRFWRIPMAQAVRVSLVCSGVFEDSALDGVNLPDKVIEHVRRHHRFPPMED